MGAMFVAWLATGFLLWRGVQAGRVPVPTGRWVGPVALLISAVVVVATGYAVSQPGMAVNGQFTPVAQGLMFLAGAVFVGTQTYGAAATVMTLPRGALRRPGPTETTGQARSSDSVEAPSDRGEPLP